MGPRRDAVGDGVTDDSVAFQNALDYCYENAMTLFLPDDCTYRICSSLTLKSYDRVLSYIHPIVELID